MQAFQSAGRIWGFWNQTNLSQKFAALQFQSAGRIWGFWNFSGGWDRRGQHVSIRRADLGLLERNINGGDVLVIQFQSAGRIWGFWNAHANKGIIFCLIVSIRRADLGLLELVSSLQI